MRPKREELWVDNDGTPLSGKLFFLLWQKQDVAPAVSGRKKSVLYLNYEKKQVSENIWELFERDQLFFNDSVKHLNENWPPKMKTFQKQSTSSIEVFER